MVKKKILWAIGHGEIVFLFLFLLFYVIFSNIATGFSSSGILHLILLVGAELGIITIGMSLLIISGEIDLSVASVFVFSTFITLTATNRGVPFALAALIALSCGCLIGLLNGCLTVKLRIPSFIVTLGGLLLWRAIVAGITSGEPTFYEREPSLFLSSLSGQVGLVPKLFFWFVGLAVIFSIVLTRTKFGNWVFAVGGDKETARALGVRADRVKIACFMITSTLAAFAGVAYLGHSSYLDPVVATGIELEVIASVVMGGILLSGGTGNLINAIVCAFVLKEIQIGMGVYGIPVVYYKVVIGALLVISVIGNRQIIQRMTKAMAGIRNSGKTTEVVSSFDED